jgi:predicted deacylase
MKIGTLTSRRGETVRGSLVVDQVHVPLAIARGKRPGPAIYLQAAQHPSEMMGVEATHHLLLGLDLEKLRGTVVVSPLAMPVHVAWSAGLAQYADLVPARRKRKLRRINPNRVWPGKPDGNLIERVVHAIYEQVCRQVDAIVDLHCCRICDYYFAAALEGHQPSLDLARAFGAPLIDLQTERSYAEGLLFLVAPRDIDRPSILVEMSPDADVTYEMLGHALCGLTNLLKHMGMVPGRPELPKRQAVVRRADPVEIIEARKEGYVVTHRRVGDVVHKGELLCEVRELDRFRPVQTVPAPFDGTLPSIGPASGLRIVHPGEEICTVKRVAALLRN